MFVSIKIIHSLLFVVVPSDSMFNEENTIKHSLEGKHNGDQHLLGRCSLDGKLLLHFLVDKLKR